MSALPRDEAEILIARHIAPHPSDVGVASYWLKDSGVPVWSVIDFLDANAGNVDAVAALFEIPREAVEAAWMFYLQHRTAIDDRLTRNRF